MRAGAGMGFLPAFLVIPLWRLYYPEFGSWNSCRGEFIRQINVLQANEFAPTKSRMFIIVLTFYVQLPDLGLCGNGISSTGRASDDPVSAWRLRNSSGPMRRIKSGSICRTPGRVIFPARGAGNIRIRQTAKALSWFPSSGLGTHVVQTPA